VRPLGSTLNRHRWRGRCRSSRQPLLVLLHRPVHRRVANWPFGAPIRRFAARSVADPPRGRPSARNALTNPAYRGTLRNSKHEQERRPGGAPVSLGSVPSRSTPPARRSAPRTWPRACRTQGCGWRRTSWRSTRRPGVTEHARRRWASRSTLRSRPAGDDERHVDAEQVTPARRRLTARRAVSGDGRGRGPGLLAVRLEDLVLRSAMAAGVRSFVDCSPMSLARDPVVFWAGSEAAAASSGYVTGRAERPVAAGGPSRSRRTTPAVRARRLRSAPRGPGARTPSP
jgi:hypothetical protein